MKDRIMSVNADTNEAVDAGRAEGDVSGDEHHAAGHAKHPPVIQHLQDRGQHHEQANTKVSCSKRQQEPWKH